MTRVRLTQDQAADPLIVPAPVVSAEEAERLALEEFGVTGAASPLPSERDRNFRIDGGARSFVVKVSNTADDEAVVDMQTQALRHISRQDASLPVVRVVPTGDGRLWTQFEAKDGRRHLVRMFTFLEGRNPTALELDRAALREWGRTVASLGRALRGFFHAAAAYPIRWDIGRAPQLREIVGHIRDPEKHRLVEHVLDRFDKRARDVLPGLRAQVVHNDMSLDNVLVDAEGRITGITDFGDMTHTALVCDLAVTLADVLDGRPDALDVVDAMVAGYASVTPPERDEAAILGDLVLARLATAITLSAWRLELYPENAAYVSTFGEGSWDFLRIAAELGFDRFSALLEDVATHGRLPYRSRATANVLERRRRIMPPPLSQLSYDRPLHIVRAEGVWMYTPAGDRCLDAYNNVPAVGHGHPRVANAVADQTALLNTNTRYLHEAAVELAERILSTMPEGLDSVLFVNSGSEANELAWRIAKSATGRAGAIVTNFAYHGVTAATTDFSPEEWPAGERPQHVRLVDAPDPYRGRHRSDETGWAAAYARQISAAADVLDNEGFGVAAMFVDSAFTSDGIFSPPPEYLRDGARAVRGAGGLFVADEVQAGFGRHGDWWSFEASGVAPDVVTLGKPMGNGYPVAAVVARSSLLERFAPGTNVFSTFGGNPVACAAALAVMDVIEDEGLRENAAEIGAYLLERLHELAARNPTIGDVRGRGLLIGAELVRDRTSREPDPKVASAVTNGMRERGVLIGVTGPAGNVLKIRPPLVFRREHVDLLMETLHQSLATI